MRIAATILIIVLFGCVKPRSTKCWECTYTIIIPLSSDSISLHVQQEIGVYSCDKLPAIPVNAINVKCKQVSKSIE